MLLGALRRMEEEMPLEVLIVFFLQYDYVALSARILRKVYRSRPSSLKTFENEEKPLGLDHPNLAAAYNNVIVEHLSLRIELCSP